MTAVNIEGDANSVEPKPVVVNLLSPEDILKSYREAIVHYSKVISVVVLKNIYCNGSSFVEYMKLDKNVNYFRCYLFHRTLAHIGKVFQVEVSSV